MVKTKDGEVVVSEIKKSSRFEESAKMQLAFYLKKFKEHGVEAKGELLFPKEKKKLKIELTREMEEKLRKIEEEILKLIAQHTPPQPCRNKFCSNCAYAEFCWS
jgi:CRISPR-associated exonuclease Cas4